MLILSGCCGLTACKPETEPKTVSRLKILHGEHQAALPKQTFPQKIRLQLTGHVRGGFPGLRRQERGIPGIKVKIRPAPSSDLTAEPAEAETDETGQLQFKVRAGQRIGDNYLEVIPEGSEAKSRIIRLSVGAQFSGGGQEGPSGRVLAEPVSVQLQNADGTPAAGVPVYFSMTEKDRRTGAQALTPVAVTDEKGIARSHVRLGSRTGEYQVAVEVADPASGFFLRPNRIRMLAMNPAAVLTGVIGGLVFFVFGMKLMSGGLQSAAGERMKKLLRFFSRNALTAMLAGTFVTAVIQSSSATTVMVIGFINAGLLTLRQSLGIIFGANIGTTVTAQIISFNLSGIALPAVTAGFLLTLFKDRTVKGWGETIMGFGLLFFGMNMMSSELKELSAFPTFTALFRTFDCTPAAGRNMPFGMILGAMFIGMTGTVLIQSSSAAMGIVLALAGSGLINFYTAVPLLVGTNIGTTVTAWLAALNANRVAKQAAMAHFLFNLIGAALMLILFYVPYGQARIPIFLYWINAITPGNAFAAVPQDIERHIAMAHTVFNLMTAAAIFPFIKGFAKICEKLLPARDKTARETVILEPRLLNAPAIALDQSVSAIRNMVGTAWDMIDRAVNRHFLPVNTDPEAFKALEETEQRVDRMQTEITSYLVQITRRPLTSPQSNLIPLLMHCVNDAERIADHAESILKLTRRLDDAEIDLSDIAKHDLGSLWIRLRSQAGNVLLALSGRNRASVQQALQDEQEINQLTWQYEENYSGGGTGEAFGHLRNEKISELARENEQEINQLARQYEKTHMARRNSGQCEIAASVIFIEMLAELERIGDHLANIAMRAPEIQKHYTAL